MPKIVRNKSAEKQQEEAQPAQEAQPDVESAEAVAPIVDEIKDVPPEAPIPESRIYCKGSQYGPLTAGLMRNVLGWQNEEEYKAQMVKDHPDQPPESFKFVTEAMIKKGEAKGPPMTILLTDHKGRKVICKKNDNNRPFDEGHCKKLCQTILMSHWVGPTTMPGETINGENIITSWPVPTVGYTKPQPQVTNGQHTGCALILAYEIWADEDEAVSGKWRELWPIDEYPEGPVIDKSVMTGISPHPRVVRSLDNIKPRSLADTICTSDLFLDRPDSEKKEASRMLSAGIDFMWSRLLVGGKNDGFLKKLYQTHTTSHDWLARHPRLLKCVEHLFIENRGRVITKAKLSSGECAAIMYLQGSSTSNQEEYFAKEEPSEKDLKWDMWEKAGDFWSMIADARTNDKKVPINKEAAEIRSMLLDVIEPDNEDDEGNQVTIEQKAGSRRAAKMVVLSKAWALFAKGDKITREAIKPTYDPVDSSAVEDSEGNAIASVATKVTLADISDFGGIDLKDAGVKRPTEAQKETASAAVTKAKETVKHEAVAMASMGKSALDKYMAAKEKYGKERIMLFIPKGNKRMVAYNEDATIMEQECDCSVVSSNGIKMTHQAIADTNVLTKELLGKGYQVAVIQELSEVEDKVALHNPVKRKLPKPPSHTTSNL